MIWTIVARIWTDFGEREFHKLYYTKDYSVALLWLKTCKEQYDNCWIEAYY